MVAEFGRIDCLVNGAGGNHPQATTRPDLSFFDIPEDALRFVFDLNLLGTIIPSQIFGRQMAEQGEGVILNVSSMSALRPLTGFGLRHGHRRAGRWRLLGLQRV